MKATKRFKTISEYIEYQPRDVATKLKTIRKIVKDNTKGTEETISYNMPAFKMGTGVFVYFAVHTNHVGLYPFPSVLEKFKKEASKYKTAKGSIQFPFDEKLPVGLITKIVKYRYREKLEANKSKQKIKNKK